MVLSPSRPSPLRPHRRSDDRSDARCRRRMALVPLAMLTAPTLLAATACGGGSTTDAGSSGGRLRVAVAFYPLAYLVEQIGGDTVEVTNLTAPGAEPHDLELSPRDVAAILDSDLVVYLSGFQPAVDDAVAQADRDLALDVASAADLTRTVTPIEDGEEHEDEAGTDPHFWLDPERFAAVADEVAARLAAARPDDRRELTSRADALGDRLDALDQEFRDGLADCERTELVTSHTAFGYLADRYGLTQVGIAGLVPDAEPTPERLAEVSDFVGDHGVTTVYFETLVSPAVAEAVADEAGVETAVLDPLEGLTDRSDGDDYLAVMRSNLQTLRSGQGCG